MELLLGKGARLDARDGDQRTPLHHTARSDLRRGCGTWGRTRKEGSVFSEWIHPPDPGKKKTKTKSAPQEKRKHALLVVSPGRPQK